MKQIDFKTADFDTIKDYVLNIHDGVFGFISIKGFPDAIRQNKHLSPDEKCKVFDIIESQSKIRLLENPRSMEAILLDWQGKENPIPAWCEAQKAIITAMEPTEATEASRPYLPPDYTELLNCFNPGKINNGHWIDFVDFIKKHRQGQPIEMARIAYILKKTEVLCNPKMAWGTWYATFCKWCGIEPNKTYQKDSKKVGIEGMPIKRLWDELNQTMFIKGGRGDALNKPHVGFDDGHQY